MEEEEEEKKNDRIQYLCILCRNFVIPYVEYVYETETN